MPFITETQEQVLGIERMIFHIVGKAPGYPTLLDRLVAVGPHESFFIARVRSTLRGASYKFQEIAGTREALLRAGANDAAYVHETQNLARRFQTMYQTDQRLSDGVLLILQLRAGVERLFDIIKFDLDPSVAFDVHGNAGQRGAVLAAISNHFSHHPDAMQKSALVRIDPNGGGEVCAVDRSSRPDITAPFQAFLDVRRTFEHGELTTRIQDVLYVVGIKHQDELPSEIVRGLRHRIKNALLEFGELHPNQREALKHAVYGPLPPDHPVHGSLIKELERKHIADEPILVVPAALPRTRRLMKETREGIQVYIPEAESDRVDEVDAGGGERYLRIRTAGLKYDDIEFERPTGRRARGN